MENAVMPSHESNPKFQPSAIPAPAEATLLLHKAASGDRQAAEQLLPLVYEQMRALAGSQFAAQPGGGQSGHTLQPTALVHEAYVRLIRAPEGGGYESRGHFMAVAAMAMRQILTDHARRKRAAKRSGGEGAERVDFTIVEATVPAQNSPGLGTKSGLDIEQLDDVLTELERLDPRRHQVVCLRFFGGLEMAEVARVIGVSLSTVEADWRSARAWLAVRLKS
jgi:RNA polymerase sigma-70 factor, ECF subfamily